MINIQSCDHAGVCQHPTKACMLESICEHKNYSIPVLAIDLQPEPAPAPAPEPEPEPTWLWQYPEPLPEPDYLLDLTWKDWAGGVAILMVIGFLYQVTK